MRINVGGLKFIGRISLLTVILSTAIACGVLLDRMVLASFTPAREAPETSRPDFKLMTEAWNIISSEYVDRPALKGQKLTYGAISGMVDALGDTGHSTFMSPEMMKINRNFVQGNFSGIGAQLSMKEGHPVIVAPMDDSPAQKAGLRSGDIILKVDGQLVADLPLDEIVSRITGKAGTPVTLTVLDPKTEKSREVTMVRAVITIHNVTWRRLPGSSVADVRLSGFSGGVVKELRKALKEITRDGATGIILDLRDNPGGMLDEAIGTASQFLDEGNVLLEKNSSGEIQTVPVESGGLAVDVPLAVLINGGSASASEIVAGAIQDANRAPLVGEKTFGTGTVLRQFDLSDGSALLLAVEEWLTPNHHLIWHKGINPSIQIPLPAGTDPLFPDKMKGMNAEQMKASGDVQLLRALDLLQHPTRTNEVKAEPLRPRPASAGETGA